MREVSEFYMLECIENTIKSVLPNLNTDLKSDKYLSHAHTPTKYKLHLVTLGLYAFQPFSKIIVKQKTDASKTVLLISSTSSPHPAKGYFI